jgi:hypothetical protein
MRPSKIQRCLQDHKVRQSIATRGSNHLDTPEDFCQRNAEGYENDAEYDPVALKFLELNSIEAKPTVGAISSAGR